jgi:DNA repair protein RecO (recombination protein O)
VSTQPKTYTVTALVLKRVNVGEADRIVTLFTREQGKLVCVAKGVRQITSTKRASLEPGNYLKAFLVTTKSLPILTQTQLHNDFNTLKKDLSKIRQLQQILEIVDALFVEGQAEEILFDEVLNMLQRLAQPQPVNGYIRSRLQYLIENLGYPKPTDSNQSIADYVSQLVDKPMKSWKFLKI